jgi:alanine-synthesizing transaminase
LGWEIEKPKASMFLWAKLPKEFLHLSFFDFCKKMILEAGIAMSPGSAFGAGGEGFVRFSLIHDEENMKKAAARLKTLWL